MDLKEILWRKLEKSSIQAQVVINGGIVNNLSHRLSLRWSQLLSLHIWVAKPCLSLTNHRHMHPSPLMLSRHSRWTNQMGESNADRKTLLFPWITPLLNSEVSHSPWWQPMDNRRAWNKPCENGALMLQDCEGNVHLSVPGRMIHAAWLIFLAFVNQISMLEMVITRAGHECQSFIANWIQLKWYKISYFYQWMIEYWYYLVLGMGKISISQGLEEEFWRSKDSCCQCTWCMPSGHHPPIL